MRRQWGLCGCLVLLGSFAQGAEAYPELTLTNAALRVRVYLPDAETGFYRGTRFDWSGVIGGLEFAGHDFFPPWFQRTDPAVRDFIYDGAEIVASPCTAVTGPAEEFVSDGKALGYDQAAPGGTFVKIGVGVLRRPDDRAYDPYRLYPLVSSGRWTIVPKAQSVAFQQAVSDPESGYAYLYAKTVTIAEDPPRLVLDHRLHNTSARLLQTSVYNHNFLFLDRKAPDPGMTIAAAFGLVPESPADPGLVEFRDGRIHFLRTLSGEDRVYLVLRGYGPEARDHDFRLEHQDRGVGVRITGDRPLSRLALWAIRAPLSLEPFIAMRLEPGAEFTWRTQYEFYRLPR